MSVTTLPPTARGGDDFNDLEFAALVADFDQPPARLRPARGVERRDAIHRSAGLLRHRTHEREA